MTSQLCALEHSPVLVESSSAFLAQMLCPHSGQGLQPTRGLDVSGDANNYHWWGLKNGDCINYFLFVYLWKQM